MMNEKNDNPSTLYQGTSNKRERSWDDRDNDRSRIKSMAQSNYMTGNNSVSNNSRILTHPTIHVSNLHMRISEPHLIKLFQKIGPVVRVHLHQNKNNHSSYAFVEFSDITCAQKALQTYDGMMILKMPIRINPARDRTADDRDYKKEGDKRSYDSKESLQNESRTLSAKIEAVRRTIDAKKQTNQKEL